MSLFIQEEYENATEGYRSGESDVYDTGLDSLGDLYRRLRREYGRCTGKVYIDRRPNPGEPGNQPNGFDTVVIGWIFEKQARYEDTRKRYLQRVWVTVHERAPVERTYFHYHEFKQ